MNSLAQSIRALGVAIALVTSIITGLALEPGPNDALVRVIDVGGGLCCVVVLPGDYYIVYDAGLGESTYDEIVALIPEDENIDLLVLSHSDRDHLGAVIRICDNYTVDRIIHSGLPRTHTADIYQKIDQEGAEGAEVLNLATEPFPFGKRYQYGDAEVALVCGFHEPPVDWDIVTDAEHNNAGSIVLRLEYKGSSVLFCGDAVGRHIGDPDSVCLATEKYMVDHASQITIDSDVIIAPHHGADNASSPVFISAVSPDYVIFSAGTLYNHPRDVTAERYIDAGIKKKNMFRTDRGDKIRREEWTYRSQKNGKDARGDDPVDILLKNSGKVKVSY